MVNREDQSEGGCIQNCLISRGLLQRVSCFASCKMLALHCLCQCSLRKFIWLYAIDVGTCLWVKTRGNTSSDIMNAAPLQVDELFDENSNLEEENTGLVGRAERADLQNAQLKEQLEEALAKVCSSIPAALHLNNPLLHKHHMHRLQAAFPTPNQPILLSSQLRVQCKRPLNLRLKT